MTNAHAYQLRVNLTDTDQKEYSAVFDQFKVRYLKSEDEVGSGFDKVSSSYYQGVGKCQGGVIKSNLKLDYIPHCA